MSRRERVLQWIPILSSYFPHLSAPQVEVLALWSLGFVFAQTGGITSIVVALASSWGCSEATLRQRLREWMYDAKDKKGDHRCQVEVSTCFAPLLRWILAWWPPDERRIALALDASALSDRFVILALCVVYRGSAMPVAWVVLPAGVKDKWQPYWCKLVAS